MASTKRSGTQGHLRVFAHYVVGRLLFLFFICHPGTLATFSDGQAYLLNRYPNRDLVASQEQLQDQRRHVTPRNPSDFSMRTGVPEDFLDGSNDSRTPHLVTSLESRFQTRVKAWLRRSTTARITGHPNTNSPGMAFIQSPTIHVEMDVRSARANDLQSQRWVSLSELRAIPRSASRIPGYARQAVGKRGRSHENCMLLGFRGRRGLFRRRLGLPTGGTGESDAVPPSESVVLVDDGKVNSDGVKIDVSQMKIDGNVDVSQVSTALATESLDVSDSASRGLLLSLVGGAADAYDSAVSFVGCALVTSPLGKRYLNAYDGRNTVPASVIRGDSGPPSSVSEQSYNLVGFADIDPFEASGRRGRASGRYFR